MFGTTCIGIIGFGVYSLVVGSRKIFPGSGSPIAMAQMLLSSIHVTAQILLGLLIISVISILIANKVIEPNSGLPVLSVISGYLLGKSFKDISSSPTRRTQDKGANEK
jgi:hypothetical protein